MWRFRSAIVRKAWAVEQFAWRRRMFRNKDYFGSIVNPVAWALGIQDRVIDIYNGIDGKARLLFWSEKDPPHRFIRPDIPPTDRAQVIEVLRGGRAVGIWCGSARCRICDAGLGSVDLLVCDMVYPERADHYLSEHDVWTPGCDELLRRLRAGSDP